VERQRGFTLIELMIVVALIAILAAVAVYLSRDRIGSAKAAEVGGVFGELHQRERQYYNENYNVYLSTGANETDYWPAGAPSSSSRDIAPIPATWQTLNIKSPKASLYCTQRRQQHRRQGDRVPVRDADGQLVLPARRVQLRQRLGRELVLLRLERQQPDQRSERR
jgi:prepilin-type N-terminal cleavage/methylation domain-containing protein